MLTFQQLVVELAQQLNSILPPGVTARADERNVIIHTRWGDDWLNLVDNIDVRIADGMTAEEAIQSAVDSKLNELQDIVTEHLATPWPQAPGMPRSEFVWGYAEVRDGSLNIWFGERDEPFFAPIRISLG